jgi:GNAT superfamily N-acetyltransferase
LSELRVELVEITHPDAQRLIEEVQEEYVVRYGGRDDTPISPEQFRLPLGAFYVGYDGTEPVASGAWRRRDDVEVYGSRLAAEVKRMYVAANARGRGLARVMLSHLEATAREAGAEVMIMETGTAQPEAMALYQSAGYDPIPSFGYYRDSPENRCYGRPLR